MVEQGGGSATGHLAYYKEHGISPVSYDIGDLAAHFDRRDSLYRSLGLPPVAFKGCDVLEVAPGSGQNSLYVATRLPARYDLVEPNPAGIAQIKALYAGFGRPHTAPHLHAERMEDFTPARRYDVVICENWLGSLPHERAILRRLPDLLATGGVLVITIVPLTGFFPNIIRRLLALRMTPPGMPFAEQTKFLTDIFRPHLATLGAMTRSHEDWVQDCLLNPHYLNVALSLETVLAEIGDRVEVLGSSPRFALDWRWFKGLVDEKRGFNAVFQQAYRENLHNFIDSRRIFPSRPAPQNMGVEQAAHDLHMAALDWPSSRDRGGLQPVARAIASLRQALSGIDAGLDAALAEVDAVWSESQVEPRLVREMKAFSGLFGRETVYLSGTVADPFHPDDQGAAK